MKTALFVLAVLAQALAFDAASIKNSTPGDLSGAAFDYQPGGGFRVRNGTLSSLIESAFDVRGFQVSGGPPWLTTDRFDVIARSQSAIAPARGADGISQTRLKLQALLAERFRLIVHREMREQQEYALTVAKGGPKMALSSAASGNPRGINAADGHLIGRQATMGNLVFGLSRRVGRPVVDRTGLSDRYDFDLTWQELRADRESSAGGPSIFTAVQEQLGLKLDSIKGPVETIVVDRAERPAAD